jgi:MoaA/NifB/PqqE/SkfB family radical SAM enzyme
MGLKKLVVELTSACNLKCDYCFKEPGNSHLDIGLLKRILREARTLGAAKITYTGGEPSLYPELNIALSEAEALGYRYALVTNGWHFSRILPLLKSARQALQHIFFSVDSAEESFHDGVRGSGSYKRILTAAELCRTNALPFSFLSVISARNIHGLTELCVWAEEVGAAGITFGHLLPPSQQLARTLSLTGYQRRAAEAEVRNLDSVLRIRVSFSASACNDAPGACCEAFAGQSVSIDPHGRLSLCCQLAEYRGAQNHDDVVADLNQTDFPMAYGRFLARATAQRARRDNALAMGAEAAAFPCDFCVATTGRINGD